MTPGAPSLADITARIRQAPPPAPMRTRIVAIDGLGGAGKSTLSLPLAAALDARIVATDDFASPDHPLDWDDRLMDQVLGPLSRNTPARYQRHDWAEGRLTDWIAAPPGGTVILEGVSSSRARFRPYLAFCIWIEVPQPVRLQRGLARDGQDAAAQWQLWQAEEDAYVTAEAPMAHADLILDGTRALPGS